MSERYSIINGEFIPAEGARIGVGDLSIGRGYGVFDFFRTVGGRPLFRADHLERLERSAKEMRLALPFDRPALEAVLHELMERNGIADSGIRITVTGGESPDGYSLARPNVIITQQPLIVADDPRPMRLMTWRHRRQMPAVKTIDYLMAVWLRPVIAENGADEVLYHDGRFISECPRNNVFLVTREGELLTPAHGVLEGITRRHVLRLARPHMPVAERDVAIEELGQAREVFITSTSKGVVPVVRIDGRPVGDGRPGDATRFLAACLKDHIAAEVGAGMG